MKKYQCKAKVISNRKVRGAYYHLHLEAPQIARAALAGQFVMLRVSEGTSPLLARPLGIHSEAGRSISCLYEALGPATTMLSRKVEGETVSAVGPLGNGFSFSGARGARPLLVAGGMGVAPLVFLSQALSRRKPLVLIGAKEKACVLCADEFAASGAQVRVATDDGSMGAKGFVSALLEKALRQGKDDFEVFACGPTPMLRAVAEVSRAAGVKAQVSLEAHMACGIGACLGCVVKTRHGLQRVCHEGPVFDAQEILWRE